MKKLENTSYALLAHQEDVTRCNPSFFSENTWKNVLRNALSEKEIKVDEKTNLSLQGHLKQDTKGKKQACIEKKTAEGQKCEDACNTSIVCQCQIDAEHLWALGIISTTKQSL